MERDAMKTGLFSIAGTRMIIFVQAARMDDRMGEVSGLCSHIIHSDESLA